MRIRKIIKKKFNKKKFKNKKPWKKQLDFFKRYKIDYIDYKNINILSNFLNAKKELLPCSITGVKVKNQRYLKNAVKRARIMALLPFRNTLIINTFPSSTKTTIKEQAKEQTKDDIKKTTKASSKEMQRNKINEQNENNLDDSKDLKERTLLKKNINNKQEAKI